MSNIAGALYRVTKIANEMKCSRRMKSVSRQCQFKQPCLQAAPEEKKWRRVPNIAGAPYKIKKKSKQKRQNRRQSVVEGRQLLYCAVQSRVLQLIAEFSHRPGLRSTNTADYIKRHTRTKFDKRCFGHAGPVAWNSTPDSIKLTTDINRFQNLLKTQSFHLAFGQFVSHGATLYKLYL